MFEHEAADYLRKLGFGVPDAAIILGTGLGQALIHEMQVIASVHYRNIPHFPAATVQSHKGQLVFGKLGKKNILVMQGRVHYYEGYKMNQLVFPIQVMHDLGVKNLIVTNAAGNLNLKWKKGEIMLIQDHINHQPDTPLRGKKINDLKLHTLAYPYDKSLMKLAAKAAAKNKIKLREGVYVSVAGPTLETRAEYAYFRFIGGDAVGMSTVPEVMMANTLGMKVCGFSILTNDAESENPKEAQLNSIIRTAAHAEDRLTELITLMVAALGQ
jgi:purine-nucleoside phosphorylase